MEGAKRPGKNPPNPVANRSVGASTWVKLGHGDIEKLFGRK
jgi:hypothetical protein